MKNFDLYLRGCVGELEDQFILYEIYSQMVWSNKETGSKIIYIHEYPITIEEAIEEVEQRKGRVILYRDALLKR